MLFLLKGTKRTMLRVKAKGQRINLYSRVTVE